ncbi:hypothetical protein V5O48_011894 [Marasmius crinis-equi]|uniref:Uncharacterized protein n=1 Tax=Marasmius crinis-equi TaxID=585013 RepID=A0ABR3F4B4_9AGAR
MDIRGFLMSTTRASLAVWKSARDNIGAPAPPNNMATHEMIVCSLLRRNSKTTHDIPPELWETLLQTKIEGEPDSGKREDNVHFRVDATVELSKEYSTIPECQKKAWIEMKVENAQVLQQNIDSIIEWHNTRECAHEDPSQVALTQRYNDIVERLGGSDTTTQCPEFRRHELVNRPEPLTEHTWKIIRPQLEQAKVEIGTQLRIEYAQARYERLKDILRETERTLPLNLIMPSDGDIAFSEPFKTIIESSLELGTDRAIFDGVAQGILKYISDWIGTKLVLRSPFVLSKRTCLVPRSLISTSALPCSNVLPPVAVRVESTLFLLSWPTDA